MSELATKANAADRGGQLRSLLTLSPIRPERLRALRARLAFVSFAPGGDRPLLDVGTIRFARWSIVTQLPHPDGSGRPRRLSWAYLLFAAAYDGGEKEYLDAFTDTLPQRIQKVFGACFGFQANVEEAPGADGRGFAAWAFRRYVVRNLVRELAFTAAAPDATVAAIRQAIAIERLGRRSDALRGEALSRAQFRVEGLALSPPSARPNARDAVLEPVARRVARRPGISPLTVVAPLTPWAQPPADRLRDALGALPDTHVARFTRVPRTMQEHLGQLHPDRLPVDYLLFTADHDGEAAGYVEAIRTRAGDEADALFGACAAYPGAADARRFRAWVDRHRLRTDYFVAGHPPRTVAELDRLVGDRTRIARWTLEGPPPPAARRTAGAAARRAG
jgi:hypothetical protein